MVKVTFYGGVNEIGGNKILLADRNTKILLDFGQSFDFGAKYFTGWLCPRAVNGLADHFEFDLMPKIRGLYAKEQLAFTDLPYSEPEINAVFLSHAHFDHVTHICFVDPTIPVYLGVGTKLFLESIEETSSFCDYKEHEYQTFRTGKRIKIDDIVVEPVHVDHSIPAASGFVIRTSEGTVVYTGDLRMHGPRKDLTEEFLERAAEHEPEALICEGTRMTLKEKRRNYSESQVERLSNEIVSSTDKIVFITHYSRDMDRFRSFYNVAIKNERKIVVSPKTAYLLGKLIQDEHLDLPDPLKDEHILVYYKRKRSGTYDDADYFAWERQYMDKMVAYEFVHNNQSKLIMDLDFYQFAELIDIKPEQGSCFIHSMSEPFSEEDIEDEVLHNWLEASGYYLDVERDSDIDNKRLFFLLRKIFGYYDPNCNYGEMYKELEQISQLYSPRFLARSTNPMVSLSILKRLKEFMNHEIWHLPQQSQLHLAAGMASTKPFRNHKAKSIKTTSKSEGLD